ncbi:MAG: ABC transporter ATP-binding protein [Anaerolineae bacterium]|nr:ABC transporter ATP-binding protein [Anaerolineae bacterium]
MSQPDIAPIIQTEHLSRVYHLAGEDIHALTDVSLAIYPGQMTAIVGRSGSGKTTLLNLIAGLDEPTDGAVWFEGQKLAELDGEVRLQLRRERIGFVFQSFGLLPLLSAAENVGVPLRMRRLPRQEREARVAGALAWVGLTDRQRHRPYELSGGEQQRVALARALAARPHVILADEPTGQLDSQTGRKIIGLLRRLVAEQNITVVIVSHDPLVMEEADVIHELRDGRLIATRQKENGGS